jgi:hypothetical protein
MKSTPFNVFAKDFAQYLKDKNLTTSHLVDKQFVAVGPYNLKKASIIFKTNRV